MVAVYYILKKSTKLKKVKRGKMSVVSHDEHFVVFFSNDFQFRNAIQMFGNMPR